MIAHSYFFLDKISEIAPYRREKHYQQLIFPQEK